MAKSKKKCLSVTKKQYKSATRGRKKEWVGGYNRWDGTRVKRYYRRVKK